MKNLQLRIFLICLFSGLLQATDIKIVRGLTSSTGNTVYVGEDDEFGKKTSHLSLSFENKKCILGVMKFHDSNEKIKISWLSGNQLIIKVPFSVERFVEFSDGYLECEGQRISITLEEYRYKEVPEEN
jgi:hypothetical protein